MKAKPLFPNQTVTNTGLAPSQELIEVVQRIVGDILAGEEGLAALQAEVDAVTPEGRTFITSNITKTSAVIGDVAGLSFPVISGRRYHFTFMIYFATAGAGDGIRLSINGPAAAQLGYEVRIPTATGTESLALGLGAYDLPAAATTTGLGAGTTLACITGVIIPSASGTVIARYASEAGNSTTVRAGSYVEWFQG